MTPVDGSSQDRRAPRGAGAQARRALRGVTPLHVVFLALVAVHLVPLWAVEYLPFMDLPQHLSTIAALHHHGDPELGYAAFFELDLLSTPYLAYYLTTDVLAYAMPVETANRVFLSLYVLLLPLATWRFLAAAGRERALSLLAFPVVYGTFLFMGLVNFVAALPFFLFGFAALLRWLEQRRRRDYVWLVVHSVVLYLSHTQAYLLYVGSVGLYLLLAWPGFRHAVRAALHLAPTLALLAVWILRSRVLAGAEAWQAGRAGRNASPAGAAWEGLGTSLRELPGRLVDAWRDTSDDLLVVLLGFVLLTLLLLRRPPAATPAGEEPPSPALRGGWSRLRGFLRGNALELVALALLGLYFALPVSYKWIWPLNWRLVPLSYLVGLAALRLPPLGPRGRAALVVPLTALSLLGAFVHLRHFEQFQDEVGPLQEVLDAAAPRRRTMGLIYDKGSGVVTPTLAPYIHFAQYYQLRKGGMADFSFANFAQSPVHFHERTGPPRLPVRWEWTPEQMRWPTNPPGAADYYDYYLVRGSWPGRGPFGSALGAEVREVARAGRWRLFERITP